MRVGLSPTPSTRSREAVDATTARSTYRSDGVESVGVASTNRIEGAPELYSAPVSVDVYGAVDGLNVHQAVDRIRRRQAHIQLRLLDARRGLTGALGVPIPASLRAPLRGRREGTRAPSVVVLHRVG